MSMRLVIDSRWQRTRALLPRLRLRYPNDVEAEQLAKLAKVDDRTAFESHIRSIILDAHLLDRSLRNVSASEVRKTLRSISKRASFLRERLEAIDVGNASSAERAGYLLETQLANFDFKSGLILLPDFEALLGALAEAADEATRLIHPKRGPKGAGGNAAFDMFVEMLLKAAWQRRGDWTNYKSVGGKWAGSLLDALEILKPYLPKGFFPSTVLGRSVEHIIGKFKRSLDSRALKP
jgi:hypothetical protein